MVSQDGGKMYTGGTVSAFRNVEDARCTMQYLDTLCEKLGYQGKKLYYGLFKNAMHLIESDFDINECLNGHKNREVKMWLDSVKSDLHIDNVNEDDVLGEVEFYTDEELLQLRTEVGFVPKKPEKDPMQEKNEDVSGGTMQEKNEDVSGGTMQEKNEELK